MGKIMFSLKSVCRGSDRFKIDLTIFSVLLFLIFLIPCLSYAEKRQSRLPKGFVHVQELIPDIGLEIRYFGSDNFVGRPVDGYEAPVAISTVEAARALKQVQEELKLKKMRLIIFDAYRPQRAVDHFIRWAKDTDDTLTKTKYYPNIKKKDLFRLNYIAAKSSHSRGSTFDVSIVDENGKKIDMGTTFDYFGPESWPKSDLVTEEQRDNRMILRKLMVKHGFKPYAEEWWHFTLEDEPYTDTYFDFPVK